ncbi:site-2 protease family protein [Candidatus Woesearchaeota archaeon]|jgi:hypothetical protein|nr:site-2 protease family protein [Candidatus Woesearchaeota archaeon]MBT4322211.1 site-2 protease family protein [Candidatus Woesearchaeota archaeon]MBT4631231.1 site-2 protease family protein [Candidatus Woesearchaeota archaeon]
MIDVDILLFGLLVLFLAIFIFRTRKKIELQKIAYPILYMIIYRTKLGLGKMDALANRFPKTLKVLSYISITIGYLGMLAILFLLVKGAYQFLFLNMPSPVGLVLPRVEIAEGLPTLSFMHWVIAIIILASVHEFSHGVFARLNKIKIKSSGFAFLGILLPVLPAAFVEPDEKQMKKAPKKAQLSVLSAGSFANFITAFVVFLIMIMVAVPIGTYFAGQPNDLVIKNLDEGGPLKNVGIEEGDKLVMINGHEISNTGDIFVALDETMPHQTIEIVTDKGSYPVTLTEHPENNAIGYMGLREIELSCSPQSYEGCSNIKSKSLGWIFMLLYWLFIINLGVGLFNLLPLGILDGGKMFYLAAFHFTKSETISKRIYKYMNIFLLLILLILILPQLYNSLIAPLIALII